MSSHLPGLQLVCGQQVGGCVRQLPAVGEQREAGGRSARPALCLQTAVGEQCEAAACSGGNG